MSDQDRYATLGAEPGTVVAGRYRLSALVGHGGMGSVWRADHLELLSPVAVKILRPEVAVNSQSVARFMREAKAAALLRSPHVVQILECGRDGATIFIAMELLEGESLHARLKRQRRLSPELTTTIISHVGRAMTKAHAAGIIHRDLKPDNVFLVTNDDEIVAKVLDFGIAKSATLVLDPSQDSPQTRTGTLLGTPYYMSPEQATGAKNVDARSDLWAMGVIAYECLVGERPYQSGALGDLVLKICAHPQPVPSEHAAVPPGFDDWFARANARDPGQRFDAAKELTRALQRALRGEASTASLIKAPPFGADNAGATNNGDGPRAPSATQSASSEIAAPDAHTSSHADEPGTHPPGAAPVTPFEPTDRAFPPVDAEALTVRSDSSESLEQPGALATSAETLQPLSATSSTRRRSWLMGLLVAMIAAGAGAFALRQLSAPSSTEPAALDGAGPNAASAASPEPTASTAPAADTPGAPDAGTESPDAAAQPRSTASSRAAAPTRAKTAPRRLHHPPAQPPPPPVDRLGI